MTHEKQNGFYQLGTKACVEGYGSVFLPQEPSKEEILIHYVGNWVIDPMKGDIVDYLPH